MKFPRRAKLFRNPFDMTAYAAVFFLMVIFLVLGAQRYTPGVKIELPVADDLPGTDKPTITVAMDESGLYYFQNQMIDEAALKIEFTNAVSASTEPLILVIQADRAVRQEKVVRLALLARDAGILEALLATLPRASASPTRQ
ncbi:MAG TPA: biopolymer transporter ExbD [Verrucomicrobiae bacterium]|nr:biopolymer transporter ExbD [Verrucomicrobiae bacterium]